MDVGRRKRNIKITKMWENRPLTLSSWLSRKKKKQQADRNARWFSTSLFVEKITKWIHFSRQIYVKKQSSDEYLLVINSCLVVTTKLWKFFVFWGEFWEFKCFSQNFNAISSLGCFMPNCCLNILTYLQIWRPIQSINLSNIL